MGTPHTRWREIVQSGRCATMLKMRSSPQAGIQRTSFRMARSARSRSPSLSSEMNHCSVARNSVGLDRKSTRLNSSHLVISYAVFCLKKKNHPESARHMWLELRPLGAVRDYHNATHENRPITRDVEERCAFTTVSPYQRSPSL